MNCESVQREHIAEQYLGGDLPEDRLVAYEEHYFQCDRCFAELRHLDEVRRALTMAPVESSAARISRHVGRRRWAWPAFAALAASLAVVAVLLQDYRSVKGPATPGAGQSRPAQIAPQVRDTTGISRSNMLARLAQAEPPAYTPPVLRGTDAELSAAYRQGMAAYAAGNYSAATEKLRHAANIDPQRADIAFFIAASELLAGHPVVAKTGFESVLALGDSAFADEAWFYLSKAQLALGDTDAAKVSLQHVSRSAADLRDEADRLVQQIDQLPAY